MGFSIKIIFFLALLQFGYESYGLGQYPISDIPEKLLKGNNAVVRLEDNHFEILSVDKARYKVHEVITVLNKKADWMAQIQIGYDKLVKIGVIKGAIYDKEGERVDKINESSFSDESNISGFSLYEDNRVKYYDASQREYPYTVEIEYELTYKYLYFIPNLYVNPYKKVAVQKSVYRVTSPASLAPKYKHSNVDDSSFSKREEGNLVTFKWEFEEIDPVEVEPYGPSIIELSPIVYLSPTKFRFEGYEGNLSTWDGMAQWQNKLNEGRGELPAATIAEVKKIVSTLKSEEEKVKALYEYVQNKTRYVSIQLGIGGYQPFKAETVDKYGYGDCKALSFYTQSLLKLAGVNSYYTWVYAGRQQRKIDKDFPYDNFNHIILCVPNKGDTLWLECTSQTNPFGYMGSFTGDRDVLVITENGGKIVHTPVYSHEDNLQIRKAVVHLDKDGNGEAKVSTVYKGLQYENDKLDDILYKGKDEQKKWLQKYTEIPSFDVMDFSLGLENEKIPEATVSLELGLRRYASVSGKRFFLSPNLMNKLTYIPKPIKERKTEVIIPTGFWDSDTVEFHLPEGLHPEYIPEPMKVTSEFGEYEINVSFENGKLSYHRTFTMKKGRFPASSYESLIGFYKKIVKADKTKAVFLSNT